MALHQTVLVSIAYCVRVCLDLARYASMAGQDTSANDEDDEEGIEFEDVGGDGDMTTPSGPSTAQTPSGKRSREESIDQTARQESQKKAKTTPEVDDEDNIDFDEVA